MSFRNFKNTFKINLAIWGLNPRLNIYQGSMAKVTKYLHVNNNFQTVYSDNF